MSRADRTPTGAHGVFSSAGVGIASLLSGLLLMPIILGSVGSGPYGLWLVLVSIASYMQYSDLGVGSAIVHFGSRSRSGAESRTMSDFLAAGLLWNAAAVVVVLPIYTLLSSLYIEANRDAGGISNSQGAWLVALGAISLASLVLRPFISALAGSGLLPVDRRNQAIVVTLRLGGTLIACLVLQDIVAVAAVETGALVIPAILAAVSVARYRLARLRWNRATIDTLKYMLSYSIRSFGVAAVGALILQSGTVLAGILLGPSAASYYNAAFRVYTSVRQLITWLVDPFRSVLSRRFAGEPSEATGLLLTLSFVTFALSSASCLLLVVSSVWVVRLWLGSELPIADITFAMSVLLLGLVINSLQIPLAPAADANGRPGAFFRIQVLWLVLSLGLSVLLSQLGIVGIALGLSLPLAVVVPLYFLRSRRAVGLSIRTWVSSVITPVALVVWPGPVLGALATLVAGKSGLDLTLASLVGTGVACAILGLSIVLFRRYLRLDEVRALLRSEL